MPDCSRKASVRVGTEGDIFRKFTRSTGWSISIPMPGRRTTRGSIPRLLAAPQRNDIRRRTEDGVGYEIVMRRHNREGRGGPMRGQSLGDLGWRYARDIAGHRHHAGPTLANKQARASHD